MTFHRRLGDIPDVRAGAPSSVTGVTGNEGNGVVIATSGLTKHFGAVEALTELSITVGEGVCQ